jgi:hypothetical protein
MSDPVETPKTGARETASVARRSPKAWLLIPLGIAPLIVIDAWINHKVGLDHKNRLALIENWPFYLLSSTIACGVLVYSRIRSFWVLASLAPVLSVIAYLCSAAVYGFLA